MELHFSSSQARMTTRRTAARLTGLSAALAAALLATAPTHAVADSSTRPVAAKKTVKAKGNKAAHSGSARATAGKAAAAAALVPVAVQAADSQQLAAFDRVNLGVSQCEFKQTVSVRESARHPGYLDLDFKGRQWLMKPVLSSTGALRLEDVRGETLFIQIRNKSMLMNQKSGQRLVDGCVHPSQLQAMSNG